MAELAVDLGTWSVAALLVDRKGRRLVQDPETGQAWSRSAVACDASGAWLLGRAAEDVRDGEPERYRDNLKRLLASDAPVHLGDSAYSVSELLGLIVARCVEHARPMTTEAIDRLTLGVPETFDGHRAEALRAAGRAAGFPDDRISLVSEPLAAARAALGDKPPDGRWLIVDLGGGTLDLALIRTEAGESSMVDAAGSDGVGGFLVDEMIVDHLRAAYDLPPPSADDHAEQIELLAAAQLLKHRLTSSDTVKAPNPYPGPNRKLTLDRARLRELVKPIADAVIDHCTTLLEANGFTWGDLTAVVATGGATRSPTIAEELAARTPLRPPADLPELTTVWGLVPRSRRRTPTGTTALATIGSLTCLHTVRSPAEPNDVAFSADGTLLAAAGADGVVRIWDADSLELRVTLEGHASAVRSVAFSPTGRYLAAANGNSIRIWTVRQRAHSATLSGHRGRVSDVTFAPQGSRIATASADGSVRIWKPNGEQYARLAATDEPCRLAYSHDGALLAVGGSGGGVEIRQLGKGGTTTQLGKHSGAVRALAFAPGDDLLASAGQDRTVRLWRLPTGQPARTLDGHRVGITGIAHSPDGTLLATISEDNALRLCNPSTGKVRRTIDVDPVPRCVAFSPDGTRLVIAGSDGRLHLWGAPDNSRSTNAEHHSIGRNDGARPRETSILTRHGAHLRALRWL